MNFSEIPHRLDFFLTCCCRSSGLASRLMLMGLPAHLYLLAWGEERAYGRTGASPVHPVQTPGHWSGGGQSACDPLSKCGSSGLAASGSVTLVGLWVWFWETLDLSQPSQVRGRPLGAHSRECVWSRSVGDGGEPGAEDTGRQGRRGGGGHALGSPCGQEPSGSPGRVSVSSLG